LFASSSPQALATIMPGSRQQATRRGPSYLQQQAFGNETKAVDEHRVSAAAFTSLRESR
jgi:hypothetical protein